MLGMPDVRTSPVPVQSLSRVWLFVTPWTATCQASLSINCQSLPRLMCIESVIPSSHLILCSPLLLLPPIPPSIRCRSPAPAARESAWRDEWCWWKMMQPLTQSAGLHVYFKLQVLFYTLTKALGQRSGQFKFPFTQIYCLHKTLLPFKQSFCFSDSLRILFTLTCDYIVTHAYVWAAYHIPQFISYLCKSCLPLAS